MGHIFSKELSVIDVCASAHPKTVNYIAAPHNAWSLHLQPAKDKLLVIHIKDMFAQAGLADDKNYYKGFVDHHANEKHLPRDCSAGKGPHRIFWTGGRWAYASALLDGFTDYIMIVLDMADPQKPAVVGK